MQPLSLLTLVALTISLLPVTCLGVGIRDSLRCPPRVLKGGRVRIRNRGRVAKYICLKGYQVLGDKYSTCIRGRWDTPVPVCINSGCLPVDVLHGQVVETYRGALVTVHCDPGYELTGAQTIYCNGARWNDSAPTCQETTIRSQKWCDFETEDLCGWTHDPNHDFDWRRHNFATPSGHVGTGPSYDHTLGIGLNGYYMYLESSSPRLVNDSARLFSPYFSAPTDPKSCFIFWYHMFGLTTGSLNVYLHKQDTLLLYTQTGDQGNYWHQATVPLPRITSNFQIVIEGVRGAGYEGDTAIDDVRLAEGEDCSEVTSTTEEVMSERTGDSSSCQGRCVSPLTHPSLCECSPDCVTSNTCCPDYPIRCLTSTTDTEFTEQATETQDSNINSNKSMSKVSTTSTGTTLSKITTNNITVPPTASNTTFLPLVINYTIINNNESLIENTLGSTIRTSMRKSNSSLPRSLSTQSISSTSSISTTLKLRNISEIITSTLAPLSRKINKSFTFTETTQRIVNLTTLFVYKANISRIVPPPKRRPLIFVIPTTLAQRFVTKLPLLTKQPTKQKNETHLIVSATAAAPKQSQTIRPKLQFLTPPVVVLRHPVKTFKPVTEKILSTLRMINKTTTEKIKLAKAVTKGISKSKNDVLNPFWDKRTQTIKPAAENKTTTVFFRMPNFQGLKTPGSSTGRRMLFPQLTTSASLPKWTLKYKRTTEAPPVHAPYAKSSADRGVLHVVVLLVCLLLLCVVTTTVVLLRRRRINRSRLEDDELDIHFLASDEMLDFTLSRPDDSQVCETMR